MKIEDVINRAVVIDNTKAEAENLVMQLQQADVPTDFIEITEENDGTTLSTYKHPRELIFVDLLLDENASNLKTNISRIIELINRIQPKDCNFYGIIVWSKHNDHYDKFIERIGRACLQESPSEKEDDDEIIDTSSKLSNPPLFVLFMDKTQYLKEGEWDFTNLLVDINTKLQASNSAYFSLNWKKTVNESIENVIRDIFNLSSDYVKHEEEISFLLKSLSVNETGESTGKNLTLGAYQAFDSLLHSELSNLVRKEIYPDLQTIEENPYGKDASTLQTISAMLNKRLFVEDSCLVETEILPGNVYKILEEDNPLIISSKDITPVPQKDLNSERYCDSKDYPKINIAIELTPPCDSAHKKIYSRFIGGYVYDIPLGCYKSSKKKNEVIYTPQKDEKKYFLYPIMLPGEKQVKCIMFDFRYLWTSLDSDILDKEKYQLWFKAKPGLFADILQKFSSHASRLGINDIHLEKTS